MTDTENGTVERFDMQFGGESAWMGDDPSGMYVYFEDYERLRAEASDAHAACMHMADLVEARNVIIGELRVEVMRLRQDSIKANEDALKAEIEAGAAEAEVQRLTAERDAERANGERLAKSERTER